MEYQVGAVGFRHLRLSIPGVLGIVGLAALFAVGLRAYQGERSLYVAFSFAFLSLLIVALRNPKEYSHLFLGVFLFIGFWLKFTLHQIFDLRYLEPTGSFDFTAPRWDEVLTIATVGCVGLLAGRGVSRVFRLVRIPTRARQKPASAPPNWYPAHRRALWLIVWAILIVTVLTNEIFDILKRGHVSQVHLPWPFHGLYAWLTDIGLAIAICTLAYWDSRRYRSLAAGFIALSSAAAAASISTLSRGIFFFQTIPFLLVVWQERKSEAEKFQSRKFPWWLLVMWLCFALAVPAMTTFQRIYGSYALPRTHQQLEEFSREGGPEEFRAAHAGNRIEYLFQFTAQIARLSQIVAVERWIGLEGLMSTAAFEGKGPALLWEAARERRSYGAADLYTGRISRSGFTDAYAQRYHYATLAGPMAFFYFSGSAFLVFLGMAAIAVLLGLVEAAWWRLTLNPYLTATLGLHLALMALQFGGSLAQSTSVLAAVFAALALVYAVQRRTSADSSGSNAA